MKISQNLCIAFFALVLITPGIVIANTGTFLDRHSADDLRVVSYNIFHDYIFRNDLPIGERFARVVNALDPDILNLQEISSHTAEDVAQLMNNVAPLPGGKSWYTHKYSDSVIVSKYPFLASGNLSSGTAALVDLPNERFEKDLFVINDHWACCDNESSRQRDANRMVFELSLARTMGEPLDRPLSTPFDLPPSTPFLVVGDLNIVGSGQPLETILTGDINGFPLIGSRDGERIFAEDSPPDWDGTSLANANPLHNGAGPENWTWRDDTMVFDPGVLDFVLYTDSALRTANQFVLNTTIMSAEELAASGLEQYDVVLYEQNGSFDHIPVVVDFQRIPEPSTALLAALMIALGGLSTRKVNGICLTKFLGADYQKHP